MNRYTDGTNMLVYRSMHTHKDTTWSVIMAVHICTCARVRWTWKHGHTCHLSFISVAVIKYSDKSNLEEKGSVLAYDS